MGYQITGISESLPTLAALGMTGKVCRLERGRPQIANQIGDLKVQTVANDFVTIAEACKQLGVAPNTLRSWGAHGKIQEYRHPLNNYRLYRLEDLTSLVQILQSPLKVGEPETNTKKKRRTN